MDCRSPAPPSLEYARGDSDLVRSWNGRAFVSLTLGAMAMPMAFVVARAAGPSQFGQLLTIIAVAAVAALAIWQGSRALHYPRQRGTRVAYAGLALGAFWLTLALLVALPRLAQ